MRLVTFDEYIPGLLRADGVVDLRPVLGTIGSLPWDERIPAVIVAFDRLRPEIERLAERAPALPLAGVQLRSPNPRPRKLLCELGDYNAELAEPRGNTDFFLKSPDSVTGPDAGIVLPKVETDLFQARGAVAMVIGRPCRHVSAEDAASYIFGYSGFIDVGTPHYGRANIGTFFGSSFDSFGPMGPCIVTADEAGDARAIEVRIRLNGAVYQDYRLVDLHYSLAEQIATASDIMSLRPGDVVVSGTFRHDAPALAASDEVVLDVSGVGALRERVTDPLQRPRPA